MTPPPSAVLFQVPAIIPSTMMNNEKTWWPSHTHGETQAGVDFAPTITKHDSGQTSCCSCCSCCAGWGTPQQWGCSPSTSHHTPWDQMVFVVIKEKSIVVLFLLCFMFPVSMLPLPPDQHHCTTPTPSKYCYFLFSSTFLPIIFYLDFVPPSRHFCSTGRDTWQHIH